MAVPLHVARPDGGVVEAPHTIVLQHESGAVVTLYDICTGEGPLVYDLRPGTYAVRAGTDGFSSKPCPDLRVHEHPSPAQLLVTGGGDVRLRVTNLLGEEVGGFRIEELLGVAGDARGHGFHNMDMRAELPCLLRDYPPGSYRLRLKRLESKDVWEGNIVVPPSGETIVAVRL